MDRSLMRFYPYLANRRIRVVLFAGLMATMAHFKGNTSLIIAWIIFAVVFLSPVTERIDIYYRDRHVLGGEAYILMLKEVFILLLLCLVFVSARLMGYYIG
jgi:hypothetical protein